MTDRLNGIPLLLAGCLCLFPFVMPYHQPPVWSFHAEWLGFALGTTACAAALAVGKTARIPPATLYPLLGLAAHVASGALTGSVAYPQQGILGGLYILFALAMVWTGAQLRHRLSLDRAAAFLAACILAGALINAMAGVIQFHGRPALLEELITELRSRRVYGNIAQSNLYANYLALGAASLAYLWFRQAIRPAPACIAIALLAYAGELSGSRAALAYALWPLALAWLLPLRDGQSARLRMITLCVAALTLAIHALTPGMNALLAASPEAESGLARLLETREPGSDPRMGIWKVAVQVITSAPWTGVGIGEFPGAAFRAGLPPDLSPFGSIWTSPHNLLLHLLAETGIVGLALLLTFVVNWGLQGTRAHRASPSAESWWVLACVGIGFTHSMIEFPFWFAHFLGLTALLMGLVAARPHPDIPPGKAIPLLISSICLALAASLAVTLRDYIRLDSTRITGTAITLASPEQTLRDAQTISTLSASLLAPTADFWIVFKSPLDRNQLEQKLQASTRAIRLFPGPGIIVRHAVFLALDGQSGAAREILLLAMESFRARCETARQLLAEAAGTDAQAIAPLQAALQASACGRTGSVP